MPTSKALPTVSELLADVSRRGHPPKGAEFLATVVPWASSHRVGLSLNGFPAALIASYSADVNRRPPDLVLENLRVRYSAKCTVAGKGTQVDELRLTIIECLSDQVTIRALFSELLQELLINIGPSKTTEATISERLKNLAELFRALSLPARRTLLGLWGELIAILALGSSESVVASWRNDPHDRFDFLRGRHAVEVKATGGPDRVHRFRLEQVRTTGITCAIASIIAREHVSGISVIELARQIAEEIKDAIVVRSFWRRVFEVGANGLEHDDEQRFDLNSSLQSLRFFNAEDVPVPSLIPAGVSNVRFDADCGLVQQSLEAQIITGRLTS